MTIIQKATTLDCTDVRAVSGFWSAALGRPIEPGASPYFARIPASESGLPAWMFLMVPEGKTAKNRMHADFVSDDRAADVERLIGLGASKIGDHDEYGISWTTLADVEGNEFCVADPAPGH